MKPNQKIALNFLSVAPQEFSYPIYRKQIEGNEEKPNPNTFRYSLPIKNGIEKRMFYWVAFTEIEGFQKYFCEDFDNLYLTQQYLFNILLSELNLKFEDKIVRVKNHKYHKRIYVSLKEYPIGNQTVWIEPYLLKETGEFGFLIDFHFLSEKEQPFNREVQKLSLSLDSQYRSNKNYHQDKCQLIWTFIREIIREINPITVENYEFTVSTKMKTLSPKLLKTKKYVFSENSHDNSQFMGIRKYGPFQKIEDSDTHYFFVSKEENIELSRDLYKALTGKTFDYSLPFPGTEKMFALKLSKENVSRIEIEDFTESEIKRVIKKIEEKGYSNSLAVILFPENDSDFYFKFKNYFLSKRILTQGIHIELLRNSNTLKWSTSNIGLQLFSKSGGIPWRIVPSNKDCLIIGVGQAHKFKIDENGEKVFLKYFGYSVLTDSSGKYVDLNILSNEKNEDNYLNTFQSNLKKLIEKYKNDYQKITLHIPFKIKKKVLDKITDTLKEVGNDKEFVVLKINNNSKFFGYNVNENSLVPYESAILKLSNDEFLMWSEGLNYNQRNANKRFSNPLHIEFYYRSKEINNDSKRLYLQDVLNLSGANWRGFNAKSIPISIYYPERISLFIKEFNERKLEEINFKNLPPWFL